MYTEELFNDEELSQKSNYDEGSGERGQDGLYRIDLGKVKPENKSRGYRAKLRFLPNFTNEPELIKAYAGDKYTEDLEVAMGPSHYQKITHFLNIQDDSLKHLKGYYDCPTNINPKTQKPYTNEKWGPFAKTYFSLSKSDNALAQEKAKMVKYSNKYFSYVLVMEDEQQPEHVGKIMIFSYGKQIKDIITSEKNGDVTGESCEVFSLSKGKDFVLLAKENTFTDNSTGKEVTAPDYTKSRFDQEKSPIKLPKVQEDGSVKFIELPLENGKIKKEHQEKVVKFLLSRDVSVEAFAGQDWDDDTQRKVSEAIDYLTGKASSQSFGGESNDESEPDDFSFDSVGSDSEEAEDDFEDLDF